MTIDSRILDIRRSKFEESITDQVTAGLSATPKTLPALLFYSGEGIRHWIQHSTAPEFYPRHEELRILRARATEMVASIADNSVVVDLGCASLEKVLPLLEALEESKKNISYYALDLSFSELQSTLQSLPLEKFKFVKLGALHGTFEDGVQWLKDTPGVQDRPHCLLLFGLTVGNYSRPNAAKFLQSLTESVSAANLTQSSIILSLDSCKMPTKVLRAYTSEGVVPFALASLDYGNNLFSTGKKAEKVFNRDEWYFLSEWNYVLGRHEASLIPKDSDIRLGGPLNDIVVSKDEKIRFGCSYKYNPSERREVFKLAGLRDVNQWSVEDCDVAFYQLRVSSE